MAKKSKTKKKIKEKKAFISNKNSLNIISPFQFSKENSFIYDIKIYKSFKKFVKSYNDYKPTNKEIVFLKSNIENIDNSFSFIENKKKEYQINEYFKNIFKYVEKIEEEYSEEIIFIKNIIEKRNPIKNISLNKIREILKNDYNINLSRSTIHRIIKNKLKYRFKKTIVKNKDLDKYKYKLISFIFIKIMIKAMRENINFIFIDESNFRLSNTHFKTWVKPNDNLHYGPHTKDKINLILAVSVNKIVNYLMTKENTNKDIFYNFMSTTLEMLSEKEIKNSVFVMDNLSVHLCPNIKELMKKRNLKILYTVPYESEFNPIELCFRYIKNFTYKKIYLKINELQKDVIEILKSEKIKKSLLKNFNENMKKYYNFTKKNTDVNFEFMD